MPEINLLQNQLKDTTYASSNRTKIVVWISLLLLLLTLGAGGGLYFLTTKVEAQDAELSLVNAELQKQVSSQKQDLKDAKIYQAKLTNLSTLLENHISMSRLFVEIGKFTYLHAQFRSFDVAQDTGKIHIEGTVDSYAGLGKLLLGLSTSTYFKNVKLLSVVAGDATVQGFNFSIDMFATPDLFITPK